MSIERAGFELSGLLRQLDSGVLIEDELGQVSQVNRLYLDQLGLRDATDAVVGTDAKTLDQRASRVMAAPKVYLERSALLRGERSFSVSEELRLANGGALSRDNIPLHQGGHYKGRICIVRRVTAQLVEAATRAKLSALVESSEDMSWSVDRSLRLLTFNQAFVQGMREGYGGTPKLGASALEVLSPERAVHWQALYRGALRGDRVKAIDALGTPGGTCYYELHLNPILTDGHVSGVAVHSRDITERREQADELLRAKLHAEEANRAKSDFLASMSHELRTPLHAVIGMAELASATALNPLQRDYLDRLTSNSRLLLDLINDILDFSKIEARKMETTLGPVDLRALAQDVAMSLAERASAKGLELRLHVPAELPAQVIADGKHLRQVLVNLVGNGIKYTERGRVTLRLKDVGQGEPGRLKLCIEVEDTGIGIGPEDQAKVFGQFFQAHSNDGLYRASGTGLGLSITRSLVELMHGELELESAPGQGSCFTVQLDLEVVEPARSAMPALRERLQRKRVLLAVAETEERVMLRHTLAELGADVLASTELAGLRAALSIPGQPQDAVLVDAELGAEGIAESLRGCGARVVLLTPSGRVGPPPAWAQVTLSRPYSVKGLVDALLPLAPSASSGDGATAAPPPESLDVLVVEDVADNRIVAKAILERSGHRVSLAEDGIEAVEAVTTRRFDVVLMDIHMPRLDGIQAIQRIRAIEQEEGLSHTPILALTAHATDSFRELCDEVGADGFVTKPVSAARLVEAVERGARGEPRPEASTPIPSASFNVAPDQGARQKVQVASVHQMAVPALFDRCRGGMRQLRGFLREQRYDAVEELAREQGLAARHLSLAQLGRLYRELQRAAADQDRKGVLQAARALLVYLDEAEIEWV